MTVKELIEVLKDMPQDYDVVSLYDAGHGTTSTEIITINHERKRIELEEQQGAW